MKSTFTPGGQVLVASDTIFRTCSLFWMMLAPMRLVTSTAMVGCPFSRA